MKWFTGLPQQVGEYIYMWYLACDCCLDHMGYVWVSKPMVIEGKRPFTRNYISNDGVPLQMHFEGVRPDEIPDQITDNFAHYWTEFNPPDELCRNRD